MAVLLEFIDMGAVRAVWILQNITILLFIAVTALLEYLTVLLEYFNHFLLVSFRLLLTVVPCY